MRLLVLLLCLMLTGCSAPKSEEPAMETTEKIHLPAEETTVPATQAPQDPVQSLLDEMTLEEKVGQLFLARCNSAAAIQDISQYHLGGLVLFGQDFDGETPDSIRHTIAGYQSAAKISLLIAVDEEGGTVTRISRYPAFRQTPFPSPRESFDQGGRDQALAVEEEKCRLLSSLSINVNLGPVCDVSTEPDAFMYQRSLGQSPEATGDFVYRTVKKMRAYGIGSVLKHFPGYGNNADTHTGVAVDSRSLDTFEQQDLLPFASGIAAGCDAVLVSHTVVQAMDPQLPASLSPAVHEYLRETMGFQGVILTDDLSMEAITESYGAGEAAVIAVLAGNDLLCSTEYAVQYEAVLEAAQTGRIEGSRLDEAVSRVLRWKLELGLLPEGESV